MNFVKKIRVLIAFCAVIISANYSFADGVDFQEIVNESNWNEALKKSAENDKLLFVDLYTDWCGYCKMMDRDVFSTEEVGSFFNEEFINVKLDAETPFGAKITTQNKVSGFPTYLFIDKNGNTVKTVVGYMKANEFLKEGQASINIWKNYSKLKEAYDDNTLSKEQYPVLFKAFIDKGEEDNAVELATKITSSFTEKEFFDSANLQYVKYASYKLDGDVFKYIEENIDSFEEGYLTKVIEGTYQHNLMKAVQLNDQSILEKITKRILPLSSENETDLNQGVLQTKKYFYLQLAEWEKYESIVDEFGELYASVDQEYYFKEAYSIIANTQEQEAIELAIKWIDKTEETIQDFKVYLLHAYAYGIMSEYEKALDYAKKAESLASSEDEKKTVNEIYTLLNKAKLPE